MALPIWKVFNTTSKMSYTIVLGNVCPECSEYPERLECSEYPKCYGTILKVLLGV